MKNHLLFVLASVTLLACAGDVQKDNKASVAQAIGAGEEVDGDVCTVNGWNDDAVCDSWCPDGDVSDCDDDGVVCATFIEIANGVCSRPADDPCRAQDPDCNQDCSEFIELANGVCERPANDPCIFQDPDCEEAVCPAIAEEPDGVCDEDPNTECPTDPDCEQG